MEIKLNSLSHGEITTITDKDAKYLKKLYNELSLLNENELKSFFEVESENIKGLFVELIK